MDVPQNVESKFRFILIAAKRARQLQAGAKPLIKTQSKKVTKIAQNEVQASLVPFENLGAASEGDDKSKKAKSEK